jgi:hypothetical protein
MSESVVSAHPAPFECSSTLGKLATALSKAQGEFPEAKKSGKGKVGAQGSQREYPYATLSDVIEAVRGPLSKNGLSIVQPPLSDTDGCASVRSILLHESGEWLAGVVTVPTPSHGAAAHALGSSIAYCRRYGLTSLLGIATEDDDGAAANEAGSRQQGRQQQRQSAPPESRGDAAANGNGHGAPDWKTRCVAKLNQLFPTAKGNASLQLAIASAVLPKPIETFEGWGDAHFCKYVERLEKLKPADANKIISEAFAASASAPAAPAGSLDLADADDPFHPNHPAQQEPSAMAQGA